MMVSVHELYDGKISFPFRGVDNHLDLGHLQGINSRWQGVGVGQVVRGAVDLQVMAHMCANRAP